MDKEMKMMVNAIIEEIGKMEDRINKRMDERFNKMEACMDAMRHEVNACKLERESISLLIKKVDQHEKLIEKMEKRTA